MSVDVLHQLPDAVGGLGILDQEQQSGAPDMEASFSVRLLPEGFSIGKPSEAGKAPPSLHEAMGLLYPYNRASESFLRSLDGGWIPGDLLEEIQCKYVDGCIICEVLDYCVDGASSSDMGPTFSAKSMADAPPTVYKITLRPSMESITKDVSSMVDDTWTYKDLMEVESKIVKTAWPELMLDAEFSGQHTEKPALLQSGPKIFEKVRSRKASILNRRLRWSAAKTMVKAGSLLNSKKIGFEMAPERFVGEAVRQPSLISGDSSMQLAWKSKNMGPLGSMALSPKTIMPNVSDLIGLSAEKQAALLGKRDGREFGSKLDIKKLKQESPVPQLHGYKADQDQAFGMGYKSTLDPIKIENSEHQQRSDESLRASDESGGIGMAGVQPPVHDSYQRLVQQDMENQAWQVSSLVGDKDNKQEELLQRKRLLMMQQKLDGRVFQQPMTNDVARMASGMAQNVSPLVTSGNQAFVSSVKDQLQMSGAMSFNEQILQGQQLARRRTNSLPKNSGSIAGAASPGSTINSGGTAIDNSPSTASMSTAVSLKAEGLMASTPKREPLEVFPVLLAVAQRHGFPSKRSKNDIHPLPDIKKTVPLFHDLVCALNTSSDEIKDPKGQRNMADSLVGGNVNSRKTRFLQFQKAVAQGPHHLRRVPVLVMCERGRDAMVEAVVQFGYDQDDETLNSVPHHVLPTMANAHAADIFAKQFCALLEKEGFELVEDQVQPTMPRGSAAANAPSNARPLAPGASSIGNNVGPLPSPRSLMNSHMPAMPGVGGMPGIGALQPSSPGALASTRMPPPANVANRQISGGYLSQPGLSTSKTLPLDGSVPQLGTVQHPQQHQPQLHMQRAAQMVMPTQLAQLSHNPAAQQLAANSTQLQQYFQQQHQRQTQAPSSVLQRKIMGMGGMGMGTLGGVSIPGNGGNQSGLGNMMAVNSINNVVGMSGISNVSASMGSMSGLNNVGQLQNIVAMGQNPALSNLIGRSGNISAAHLAAFSSKPHLTQGRNGHPMGAANPNSASRENLSCLNPTSQLHGSTGMPIMGQAMNRAGRVGLTSIQRASPIGSLSSPRVATSNMPAVAQQGMYLSSTQQAQQQFNIQQLSPMQQQQVGQQQALAAQQMQLTQSQQMNSQVQQQQQQQQLQQQQPNPSQQLNIQQAKSSPQMLTPQSSLLPQIQQQSQQQLSMQASMNPSSQQQNAVGSLGSLVGGPASPQLSSQNVGSVTSANNMDQTITNCSATSISSG